MKWNLDNFIEGAAERQVRNNGSDYTFHAIFEKRETSIPYYDKNTN
jgi:hypothetical protein